MWKTFIRFTYATENGNATSSPRESRLRVKPKVPRCSTHRYIVTILHLTSPKSQKATPTRDRFKLV